MGTRSRYLRRARRSCGRARFVVRAGVARTRMVETGQRFTRRREISARFRQDDASLSSRAFIGPKEHGAPAYELSLGSPLAFVG